MNEALVHVAVGAIVDAQNRVLVSLRPDHVHQGGLWEFPGGKLEQRESTQHALARELKEELDIEVQHSTPLIKVKHHYSDKSVLLDVHSISEFTGIPKSMEGQPIDWVDIESLDAACFPAADRSIIQSLRLPNQYLITGTSQSIDEFEAKLTNSLKRGIRLVQYRAPKQDDSSYRQWLRTAKSVCDQYDAILLANRSPEVIKDIDVQGTHLTSRNLWAYTKRPISENQWLGASCHNAEELLQSEKIGVDFAVLSPVLPTSSHPDAAPLGWQQFEALVDAVNIPVFALGGMGADQLNQAKISGAQGVAGISEFWMNR